jgi:hypothetical protein
MTETINAIQKTKRLKGIGKHKCVVCGKKRKPFARNYAGRSVRETGSHAYPERIEESILPGDRKENFLCVRCANNYKPVCQRHGVVTDSFLFGWTPICKSCAIEKSLENTVSQLKSECGEYLSQTVEQSDDINISNFVDQMYGESTGGLKVVDLRSDKYKQITQDVAEGAGPQSHALDTLIQELLSIGSISRYFVTEEIIAGYDTDGNHARARGIGTALDMAGGKTLMQIAWHRVKAAGGDTASLSVCWDGIGEWRR